MNLNSSSKLIIGLHGLQKIGEYHCLLPTNSYKTSLNIKVGCLLDHGFKGNFILHFFMYLDHDILRLFVNILVRKSVDLLEEKGWNVEQMKKPSFFEVLYLQTPATYTMIPSNLVFP